VDKPTGPTSHDVVQRVRRLLGDRRVGHTGTLDPMASGLLLLCCGPATRLSNFLVGMDKSYTATLRLGVETDTLDAQGAVVTEDDKWRDLTDEAVVRAAAALEGPGEQVPPAYSAKKIGGEAAHRRVRRGERVELDAVPVVVHRCEVTEVRLPEVDLVTRVSSGTFVRSLGRDLASALGTCGHLVALRRTAVGEVDESGAAELEALEAMAGELPWIAPLDALRHLPLVEVDTGEARRIGMGQRVRLDVPSVDAEPVRVAHRGCLVAVGSVRDGVLHPKKVFLQPEEVEG
jgi:tRNA pseudouridine55 synthase